MDTSWTNDRERFLAICESKIWPQGAHSVTFQPLPSESRMNEDRLIVEEWDVAGRRWIFMAVLDGHGGVTTSEYTRAYLPKKIRHYLRKLLAESSESSRDTLSNSVSDMLERNIEIFDRKIGEALMRVCPHPSALDDAQAQALVDEHFEILARAFHGSTLTVALIDETHDNLWVAGVGDSTVAMSRTLPDGTRTTERLLMLHSTSTPSEFAKLILAHPSKERGVIINGAIFNSLTMTRSIGDFSFKYRRTYSTKLLFLLQSTFGKNHRPGVTEHNKTPPYICATPSVRYIDLAPLKDQNPSLILFTDGVDKLVEGYFTFHRENPRTDDPSIVVGALLDDNPDVEYLERVLGHSFEDKWLGAGGNRATEILGNLLAGTDPIKWAKILDIDLLTTWTEDKEMYVDDTTIVLYELFKNPVPPSPTP